MKDFLFKDGQKVVFIGDSITDCGRRDNFVPFGNGYVKVVIDLITACYPERKINYFNEGISGNTVEDLFNRWNDDILIHKPDWISIKIGINDIHRFLNNEIIAASPEHFAELYYEILNISRKKTKAKFILIDPFYISIDRDGQSFRSKVLELLPKYKYIIHKLAKQFNAISVRTHEAFQKQLKYKTADYFCPEPVHPYLTGHIIIAYELLKELNW